MSAGVWLRELGAVRPMAPAGREVLVLGDSVPGPESGTVVYPIKWSVDYDYCPLTGRRYKVEDWRIFGVKCEPLTKDDAIRIIMRVNSHDQD